METFNEQQKDFIKESMQMIVDNENSSNTAKIVALQIISKIQNG